MILITKGKGGYSGIELVEVLWKVCAVVVNCRLKRSVVLHNELDGFITWRGTGMATLEANMDQKLISLAQEPLFQVFSDLQKAYDLLDWER